MKILKYKVHFLTAVRARLWQLDAINIDVGAGATKARTKAWPEVYSKAWPWYH